VTAVRYVASPDGTRIAYRASGSGEPVLFVHGASTSGADWVFVGRLLRERFMVVTMDRRGRGDSGDGPAYSIEREAEDILAVLDGVGAELLVGHCELIPGQRHAGHVFAAEKFADLIASFCGSARSEPALGGLT
jgi:alpha-beta hydrolase superfamily lysophospholipase